MKNYTRVSLLFLLLMIAGSINTYGQITVTKWLDDLDPATYQGTLRWAVDQANATSGAIIEFHSLTDSKQIEVKQQLILSSDVSIIGNGENRTFIYGVQSQLFKTTGAIQVSFEEMSLFNGRSFGSAAGGAIEFNDGSLTINNCTFRNCKAPYRGGAIFQSRGAMDIRNSTFVANNSTRGGAIYANGGSTTITNSLFHSNSADTGGAFNSNDSNDATIWNSEFRGNEATVGGGICFRGNYFKLYNSLVSGNTASNGGGGIHFDTTNGEIVQSTIASNQSSQSSGSGLLGFATGSGVNYQVVLKNNIVALNKGINTNQVILHSGGISIISQGGNLFEVAPRSIDMAPNPQDLTGTVQFPKDPKFNGANITTWPNRLGDFRLKSCSPAITLGINAHLPADAADIDNDGNTTELLPRDLAGSARIATGSFITPTVDAGAYEFQGMPSFCTTPILTPFSTPAMNLYPSPNNGLFTVELKDEGKYFTVYQLFNKDGELMLSHELKKSVSSFKVDIREYKSGVYVLKAMTSEKESYETRFVKE